MAKAFDVDGNRLSLLTDGPGRLDALVALIEGAQTSLKLLYYMYVEDEAGQRIHNALLAAAARGVTIALIVDGFGSDAAAHEEFFKPLNRRLRFSPALGAAVFAAQPPKNGTCR
jgi:cardiolipin synthase A/B